MTNSSPNFLASITQFIFACIIISIITLGVFGYTSVFPNSAFSQNLNNVLPTNSLLTQNNTPTQITPNTNTSFIPRSNSKSVVDIINQNLPSVLSINVIGKNDNKATAGTGYIVSDDGLVITNKHVISLLCGSNNTTFQTVGVDNDQRVYDLELKSVDPVDDIAILKIKNPTNTLKKVEFGDSNSLQLGEDVVAVGNALGTLQNSVTKGVVSGLDRSFESGGLKDECTNSDFQVNGLIQTDAAINKGNSGGPLFNSSGQIIGMNTLGTVDAQGVGLAIPSATILASLNSYLKNNQIIRPRLGVITQEIDPTKKLQNTWLPVEYGEFIGSLDAEIPVARVISSGSSAEEAGFKYGDIILEVNGEKLVSKSSNPSPLRRKILTKQANETIELTYLKAKNNDNNREIQYESSPRKVTVKLKGISYNLQTSRLQIVLAKE
jgi:S1-C subfamily serine protease